MELCKVSTHCSLSMSMSLSSKSEMRSCVALSNMKVTLSPLSSA